MTVEIANIIKPDYPERLAVRETGRLGAPGSIRRFSKLALFPDCLHFRDIIPGGDTAKAGDSFRIDYPGKFPKGNRGIFSFVHKIMRLIRHLFIFDNVDLYLFSRDRLHIIMALLIISICKIKGVSVSIYDYTFRTDPQSHPFKTVLSLCNQVIPNRWGNNKKPGIIDSRNSTTLEEWNDGTYQEAVKERAVPRVIVAGDFGSEIVLSMAEETHRLIKQKYPRTEFSLVSLIEFPRLGDYSPVNSIKCLRPENESDIVSLYSECDSLILLSPGGLNGMFLSRAKAARFPVILNGFELSDNEISLFEGQKQLTINTDRDSFSALASAVIDLVDNEEYYRSFR